MTKVVGILVVFLIFFSFAFSSEESKEETKVDESVQEKESNVNTSEETSFSTLYQALYKLMKGEQNKTESTYKKLYGNVTISSRNETESKYTLNWKENRNRSITEDDEEFSEFIWKKLDYWLNFTLIMETGQYMRETLTNRTFIVIRTLKTSAEEIILLLQKSDNYFSQFLIIGEFKFRWVTLLFLLLACCIGFLILFRRKNQKQKVYNFPVRNALIDSKQPPQIWNNRPIYIQLQTRRIKENGGLNITKKDRFYSTFFRY